MAVARWRLAAVHAVVLCSVVLSVRGGAVNKWSILPPRVSTSRSTSAMPGSVGVSLNETHFLVHGGSSSHASGCDCVMDLYRYSYGIATRVRTLFTKNMIATNFPARWSRCGHVLTTFRDSKTGRQMVYMFGGRVGSNAGEFDVPMEAGEMVSGADVLDPNADSWEWKKYHHKSDVPPPRSYMAHHETDKYLYIHGGSANKEAKGKLTETGVYSDIWRLDREAVEWEAVYLETTDTPATERRVWRHTIAVDPFLGDIYVVGGCTRTIPEYLPYCGQEGSEPDIDSKSNRRSVSLLTSKYVASTGSWITVNSAEDDRSSPCPLFGHLAVPSVNDAVFTVLGGARYFHDGETSHYSFPPKSDCLHTFNMTSLTWSCRRLPWLQGDFFSNGNDEAPRVVEAMAVRIGCGYTFHDLASNDCLWLLSGGTQPGKDGDTPFTGSLKYNPSINVLTELNFDAAIGSQHLTRAHAVTSRVTGVVAIVGGSQNKFVHDAPYAMGPGINHDILMIDVVAVTWHFVRPPFRYNSAQGLSSSEELVSAVLDPRPGTDGFFISNCNFMMYFNFTSGHLDTRMQPPPCLNSALMTYERDGRHAMISIFGFLNMVTQNDCSRVYEIDIGTERNGWPDNRPEWRDITDELSGYELVDAIDSPQDTVALSVGQDWFLVYRYPLIFNTKEGEVWSVNLIRFDPRKREFRPVPPPDIGFQGWFLDSWPFNAVPLYDNWLLISAPKNGTSMSDADRAHFGIPTEEIILDTKNDVWTRLESKSAFGTRGHHRQNSGAVMSPCYLDGDVHLFKVDARSLRDPSVALHEAPSGLNLTEPGRNATVCSVGGSLATDMNTHLIFNVFRSADIETFTPGCNLGSYSVVVAENDPECPLCRKCIPCPPGTYLGHPAPMCHECPLGTTTRGDRSTKIEKCNICVPNACNGASCAVVEGRPQCYCSLFYGGDRCSNPIWLYVAVPSIVIVLVALLVCYWIRRIRRRTLANLNRIRAAGRMDEAKRVRGEWAIDPDQIEIVSRLGAGASGVVYLGKWFRKKVAVKEFHGLENEGFVEEMDHLIRLHHPNIIRAEGYCLNPPYLITEYAELGSLEDHLRKGPRMHYQRKRRFALDIARGVEYLHSLSPPILHRDLKPANVVIALDDTAKLCDFGIARKAELDRTLTMGMGTASYTAPEVHFKRPAPDAAISLQGSELGADTSNTSSTVSSRGQPYGTQADVFSFGVLLWEILTEEIPYAKHQWSAQIVSDIVNGVRPPIPEHLVGTPMEQLIIECWSHDPIDRPDFSEIVHRLQDDRIWLAVEESSMALAIGQHSDTVVTAGRRPAVWNLISRGGRNGEVNVGKVNPVDDYQQLDVG